MDLVKLFRMLIIGEVVLFAATIAVSLLVTEPPAEVTAYLEGTGAGPLFDAMEHGPLSMQIVVGVFGAALFLAYIASLIGMWSFRRWARTTYIGIWVLSLVLLPASGSSLSNAVESTVEYLSAAVSGALLAALLFEPVRARFAAPTT
jgi:hypothetical protein